MQVLTYMLILMLIIFPISGRAAEGGVMVELDALAYIEPVSYKHFIGDWGGSLHGGERSWLQGATSLGAELGSWGIVVLRQEQLTLRHSEDTTRFYYLTENRLDLDYGHTYNIDLDFRYMAMEGVKLQRRFKPRDTVSIVAGVSRLEGRELLQGSLRGSITPLSAKDYQFSNLNLVYHYTEDKLFDRQVASPSGEGFGLDFLLGWQPSPVWKMQLQAKNLLGYLDWKNAPITTAQVTSDNKEYDSNGYAIVHPALTGQHGLQDFRQPLMPVWRFNSDLKLAERTDAVLEVVYSEIKMLTSIGMGYHTGHAGQVRVMLTPEVKAVGLGYLGRYGRIYLSTDNIALAQGRVFTLQAMARIPF